MTWRIPTDRFPFTHHRTWEQVLLTEAFQARLRAGNAPLSLVEAVEYGTLISKAQRFNPSSDDGGDAA